MGELSNCPKCGRLYVQTTRRLCDACYKEEEKEFETVYTFIRKRENRQATLVEIAEGTGVRETIIIKFLRQGRLRASAGVNPNLTYPCSSCGNQIRQGKVCDNCRNSIQAGLDGLKDEIAAASESNQNKTYFAFDKSNKKS